MAPPKRNHRNTRSAQYIHSDYDTDTANLTDMALPTASPMPPRTNEELNLSVLQRHDPSVHQILSVAPFAVVYLFNTTSSQWEKCGIEGTMFICSLLPPPSTPSVERYCVTVLNRRGLDNFQSELLSANDVEVTDEYVILQVKKEDGETDIFGLWIFSEKEGSTEQTRLVNALIVQECAMRAENSRDALAVADVEDEYVEETPEPEQYEHPLRPQYEEPIKAQHQEPPRMQQEVFVQPQSQQVNLLDLFKGKPAEQTGPSLASPFPSQSQHQYFPQHQMHHYQQHQQHAQPPMQQHYPQSHNIPPGFGQPQPPQAQADVLANLFLNARRGY